jgi:hypothetical protein
VSVGQQLWETFRKLSALEARTDDVTRGLERIEAKVDQVMERLVRVEVHHETLRASLRSDILADIKAEVAVVKFALSRLEPALSSSRPPGGREIGGADVLPTE